MRASFLIFVLATLVGCAGTPSKSDGHASLKVVEQYLAALNRRDLMVLTAYVTPNVEWYSVLNGEYLQEVAGREQLVKTLQTYYSQNQQTHWTVEQSMTIEQRVVVRERSVWRTAEGPGERTSLVVYELREGRIARINYFLDAP